VCGEGDTMPPVMAYKIHCFVFTPVADTTRARHSYKLPWNVDTQPHILSHFWSVEQVSKIHATQNANT